MVGIVTGLAGSQRIGIAAVTIPLMLGLFLVMTVREERVKAPA